MLAGAHLPEVAAAVIGLSAAAQSPCLVQVDGAVHGVSIAGVPAAAGYSVRAELSPGSLEFTFRPGGGGRPAPLTVQAPPDSVVVVAVDPPPMSGEVSDQLAESLATGRLFGELSARDLRLRARVQVRPGSAACGLVCRQVEDGSHYRLVWYVADARLRLERKLHDHLLLLAEVEAPAPGADWHNLELQVDGFRLQAFCDDLPVAQVMDGALANGRYGTYARPGAKVSFEHVVVAPPARPLASVAAVTTSGHTAFLGQVPEAGGSIFVLCLRLDTPMPVWPTDAAGFEPFLLQRTAEPLVLIRDAISDVGPLGAIEAAFSWPTGQLLRGHAALLGGWVSTPDQQALLRRLPWAAVRF